MRVICLWCECVFAKINLRLYFLIPGDLALSFASKMQPKTVPKLNIKEVWPDQNDLNAQKWNEQEDNSSKTILEERKDNKK